MGKGKFYAVRKGRKTGVFNNWKECEKSIKGYSGAEYKSFQNKQEASEYLLKESINEFYGMLEISSGEMIAYVDGSYDDELKYYGSGIVIITSNKKVEKFNSAGNDKDLISMRNVAGEIMAAIFAMKYAVENNMRKLYLYHDYVGIEKWCNGEWKTNKLGTKKYKQFYDEISKKVNVIFIKVKAHSGNRYNDEADLLAKQAINDIHVVDKETYPKFDRFLLKQLKGYKRTLKFNFLNKNKIITYEDIYSIFKRKWELEREKLNDIKELKSIYSVESGEFIIVAIKNNKDIKKIVINWEDIYECKKS